jgi:hypothetical protein
MRLFFRVHLVAEAATRERWAQQDQPILHQRRRNAGYHENPRYLLVKTPLPSKQSRKQKGVFNIMASKTTGSNMPMPSYKNGQLIDINKLASSMSGWICPRCKYLQKIRPNQTT